MTHGAPPSGGYDAVIIGAGAAGLMCAAEAGRRGRSVLVIEHNASVGEKIRISGGGRCNFTNLVAGPEHFLSDNEHFCTSALARFTPRDFISLVEKHRIPYHEKKSGQLFCDASSREIIAMLMKECGDAGAGIATGCRVESVERAERFTIRTGSGEFSAGALVVATGGLSVPALGATDLGYRLARQFGLAVTPVRPGLVPLTVSGPDGEMMKRLSGVSLAARVACRGAEFLEQILFTHRGLSGPAILQISSFWIPGGRIAVDLLPGVSLIDALAGEAAPPKEMATFLGRFVPRRFAQEWCSRAGAAKPPSQWPQRELLAFEAGLHRWIVEPDGTEGFGKAEVTCGGVDTAGLSSKTMEARSTPGLYFIGEVVDVTGHLGGYNFQWAWASGAAAGRAV